MTRLKDATFEGASLTGTNGFTSTTGSPTLDSTSKVRGTYSARTNWASATNMNGTISGLNEPEIWFSFYIYVAALPTTGAPRVVTVSNGSTQFNITLNSSGVLTARLNTSNQAPSIGTVSLNTAYRVGVHLKVSTAAGNSDGVMDVYFATGDAAFGSPILTTSSVLMNTTNANFSSITFGMNNGVATTGDVYWDSIRIDNVSMPSSDGSTDTPKTVNVTVSNTLVTTKGVGKPIIQSVTATPIFAKGLVTLKTITLAVTSTVPTALKNVGKPITRTVTTTLVRLTNIPRNVLVSVTPIVYLRRDFAFTKVKAITSNITAVVGKGYFRSADIIVTVSSVISKNILKPIVMTQTVVASVGPKSIAKTIARDVTATVSSIYGKLILKTIEYIATVSVNKHISIGKTFLYVQNTVVTIQRSFTLLIERMVVISALPSVSRNIEFTKALVVNIGLAFSKLLANAFTNTYLRKNTGELILAIKNTALQVLGKNARTLDLKDTNES